MNSPSLNSLNFQGTSSTLFHSKFVVKLMHWICNMRHSSGVVKKGLFVKTLPNKVWF